MDPADRSSRAGASTIEISDEELEREALAADPDAPLAPDATEFGASSGPDLLPDWYMPAPRGYRRTRGRRFTVVGVIAALLVVNGAGLCVTYGFPEIAW